MKKLLLALLITLSLTACETWKPVQREQPVVVRQEYILRIPPADLMTPPADVPPLDVDKATQGDIAKWLILREEQLRLFKEKFQGIARFLTDEQSKLDAEAAKKNGQ